MSQVQISKTGVIGELLLNGAKTLNALTLEDIRAMAAGLAQHEGDPSVRAIVVRSTSEKVFCAGGDVKQIREFVLREEFNQVNEFFTEEYALNLAISRCSKPYIALVHGIAMGGGLGISIHGSARVVTETSLLAMPETRIGFFPDVGASYFLPRLAQRAGYWMALTAAPVKGHQALSVGLATHYIDSQHLNELPSALSAALESAGEAADDWHQTVNHTLDSFSAERPDDNFAQTLDEREAWFADDDLDNIRQRLAGAAQQSNNDAQHLLKLLDEGSPHAARITLQLLRATKGQDLQACLQMELALCAEAVQHPDCAEGIRAVLVDKDRNPAWQA